MERYAGKVLLFILIFGAACLFWDSVGAEEENTYSISLTKTAEAGEEIREIAGSRVLSETHVVEKGEHFWKLMRERGLLNTRRVPELLQVLKQLNPSLGNLDLIHPGEKIVIPLKIVPIGGSGLLGGRPQEAKPTLAELKEADLRYYTVKPGDSLSKVVMDLYDIPSGRLYGEYLALVRKLNPTLKDLNAVYPGQKVRLPVYSPQIVRSPVIPQHPLRAEEAQMDRPGSVLSPALSEIFRELGEEWIQSGQQFIPLRSGGQVDLKAESYPSIHLRGGRKVIVDLNGALPDKMGQLIESSWHTYRVVPLVKEDGLAEALRKILDACGYAKVLKPGEELEFQGEIPFRVSGDWVVVFTEKSSERSPHTAVINLDPPPGKRVPMAIRDYLGLRGVKVIEYPKESDPPMHSAGGPALLERPENSKALVHTLLDLTGRAFSKDMEIPVYQSQKADAKLVIKADILLKIEGEDAIIDLSGLDAEVVSFLKEHAFRVLAIQEDMALLDVAARSLQFLGVPFTPGPQSFAVSPRSDQRNIRFALNGVLFSDRSGRQVLATPLKLPQEIAAFLGDAGYHILPLSGP